MIIKQALRLAAHQFLDAYIDTASLDARIILGHVLGKSPEYIISRSDEELTSTEEEGFLELVNRRASLEPIAYIIGYREFYGRNFQVNHNVLIPRPDTEILIDAILAETDVYNILDLGTGSGCIVITLLLENPNAQAIATDISNEALQVARSNALSHKVDTRLELVRSNWFASLREEKFDIIVSNPPYISRAEESIMAKETIAYEPHLALFAEQEGLDCYKAIALEAKNFLKPSGKIFLEVGFNQADQVTKIFTDQGYKFSKSYKDLSGHTRVVSFIAKSL